MSLWYQGVCIKDLEEEQVCHNGLRMAWCKLTNNPSSSSLVLTILIHVSLGQHTGSNTLHIGAFYPLSGSFSTWGRGCLPAAQLALDDINNRSDILPRHVLHLENADTQGSPGVTTRELFRMLHSVPNKVALLGPYLSTTSIAVAQTARWWHLLQVAPTPFTPELSDRNLYPYVFRIRAALTTFNPARVELIRAFGWKRVAILTRQTGYFIQTTDMLFRELKAANLQVVTTEVYQTEDDPVEELLRLKKLNARVIFIFAYDEYARKIFCQVHKLGMYGPRYVWILHYSNDPYWMNKATSDGLCTSHQIQEAAANHFVTRDVTLREDDVIPQAGFGTKEFIERYKEKSVAMATKPSEFYAPIVYDALWTLALALNSSIDHIDLALSNSTSDRKEFADTMLDVMNNITFEGMTGTVKFTHSGDIATLKTKIMRYEGGSYVSYGAHDALYGVLTWTKNMTWPGDRIPFDDIRIHRTRVFLPDSVFYVMISISLLAVVLSLLLLWYNIYNRHQKIIRMSSPNLNNLIITGGILTDCCVISAGCELRHFEDNTIIIASHLKYATLLIGYSLGFGALFAKTWRVFKIFTSKTAKKVVILDSKLFLLVSAFLLVDIMIMLLWFTIDPIHLVNMDGQPQESDLDPDIVLIPWVRVSVSRHRNILMLVMYSIKGLSLFFGVFLSCQTRGVKIPALNDSRHIGFAIYNVVTISLLAIVTTFLIESINVTLLYIITGSCIITASLFTQCVVFIPKVLSMFENKVAPTALNIPLPSDTMSRRSALEPRRNQIGSPLPKGHSRTMVCTVCSTKF